jgi:hypothetical protein
MAGVADLATTYTHYILVDYTRYAFPLVHYTPYVLPLQAATTPTADPMPIRKCECTVEWCAPLLSGTITSNSMNAITSKFYIVIVIPSNSVIGNCC